MKNVHKNQLSRQTGSRNLTGPKMLPTIWHTYMKLVTKYQIPVINSCLEKCDEKWAYMFNVYKNQQSRQTGSRNLMGPKTLPTIWGTYMKLVTKYQISAINSYWEKCDEKCAYTVLPRSIAPRFIANLAYRQNYRLSRFPPLKIPRYTAKLRYCHPPQVFRHKSRKTNLNSPVSTAHNYPLTSVY
jgi:hypothetical protein